MVHVHVYVYMVTNDDVTITDILTMCSSSSLGLEVPCGCTTVALLGFVEELVVNDDPEYQVWSCVCA